jgi:hypothetical protein
MRSVYDCHSLALTRATFYAELADIIKHRMPGLDESEDNDGQVIIYTGYYSWSDGTIRDYPEGA